MFKFSIKSEELFFLEFRDQFDQIYSIFEKLLHHRWLIGSLTRFSIPVVISFTKMLAFKFKMMPKISVEIHSPRRSESSAKNIRWSYSSALYKLHKVESKHALKFIWIEVHHLMRKYRLPWSIVKSKQTWKHELSFGVRKEAMQVEKRRRDPLPVEWI